MTDWKERALAAEQRYVELDRTSERELAACEKERDQWYAAFVNAGKLGEAAEKRCAALAEALRLMVYETTHLSAEEDDGSHICKISKQALSVARAALAAAL